MEALKKLEKVQLMLSFMQEQGLSSNDPVSDRFIADFLLFMVHPVNSLNMEKKFLLILGQLQKISAQTLEAFIYAIETDHEDDNVLATWVDDENAGNLGVPAEKLNGLPLVGLEAMEHANSTLEDFCRSYFIFHELDANNPHAIFKFLPILYFTESFIYQLDMMNEREMLPISSHGCGIPDIDLMEVSSDGIKMDELHTIISVEPFAPLLHVLQSHGLLTKRMLSEFKYGIEYWFLERKLCKMLHDINAHGLLPRLRHSWMMQIKGWMISAS